MNHDSWFNFDKDLWRNSDCHHLFVRFENELFLFSCFNMVCCCLDWCAKKEPSPRTVWVGKSVDSNFQQFPPNVIRNQKYSIFSFIPVVRPFTLFELRLYLGVVHKLRSRWCWKYQRYGDFPLFLPSTMGKVGLKEVGGQ